MKEEHRSNLHTFCIVLCTTTFMVYTYLYKQDVNIKRKMLNNYDIVNTEDISTYTVSIPTSPKIINKNQTTSTIKLDKKETIN